MVSAKKLLYDLRRKIEATNSGRDRNFRVVDLVSFINDAYEIIIEHLISEKDQNETIRNHLRPLMVHNYKLECKDGDDCRYCYVEYPDNFYELINTRVSVCHECCDEIKSYPLTKPQGDDIEMAILNPYRKSDYYFEQMPSYEYGNGLRLYHSSSQEVKEVRIDYYKKIQRIDAPSLVECTENIYLDWDGRLIVNDIDFEIGSTYLNRKVTDVAAVLALNASSDFVASNEKIKEIIQINTLHK